MGLHGWAGRSVGNLFGKITHKNKMKWFEYSARFSVLGMMTLSL
jgi:hypothetical protein